MADGLDPSMVKPSRHSLYMRGFHVNVRPDDVRGHFVDRGYDCNVVFFATVRGALNVALRFDSHEVAKRILQKYTDGQTPLLGCRVSIVWFRDMQAARERVRNDPELRRMLEEQQQRGGTFRPTGPWRGRGGGGGGRGGGGGAWMRRRGDSYGDGGDYPRQYADEAPATSSRSSRSRSRSAVSGDSRSRLRDRRQKQPPPAPSHRPESPPSPSRSRSRSRGSPSRSRSRSPSRSRDGSESPDRSRSRSPLAASPKPSASAAAASAALASGSGPSAPAPPVPLPTPSAVAAPAAVASAAAASAKQQTAKQLVRRRKAEIEGAYRQDCDTFATVVKMLLRQDPGLDGPIQAALKASLRDIGDQSVAELRRFIDGLRRGGADAAAT